MNFEDARKVADAVLFEGYVLYPYRASAAKNRVRWQFGVVAPRAWSIAGGPEPWEQQTQCLLEADDGAALELRVRFLHVKDGPAEYDGDYMVPVGQGRVDIPAVLAAGTGVRWHIVELDRSRTEMFSALRQSYDYLVGNGFSRGRR